MKLTAKDADLIQAALLARATKIITPKRAGYSPGADPFSNFRIAQAIGVEDWRGCLVRLLDKVGRAASLTSSGSQLNEAEVGALVRDSVPNTRIDAILDEDDGLVGNSADLINYVVLHLCLAIERLPDDVANRVLSQLGFQG